MNDLKEMGLIDNVPKLLAAEVFHSAEHNLAEHNEVPVEQPSSPSIQTSIATGWVTYQTLRALEKSGGAARSSSDEEALEMQKMLAAKEGVFAETSSCASLVALAKMVGEGRIRPDDKVVALITSTGIKTTDVTAAGLPEASCIKPDIDEFRTAMKEIYDTEISM